MAKVAGTKKVLSGERLLLNYGSLPIFWIVKRLSVLTTQFSLSQIDEKIAQISEEKFPD